MSSNKELAINGGQPVRQKPFPKIKNIGPEERQAVLGVLDSDLLSGFAGSWTPAFFGGPKVQKLERDWETHFGVKHAVAMNSATSCLYAAIAAAAVEPGDEVIVTPYSMICSATCALVYNAIPIFADIDPENFCLSPKSIRARITPRTKAIVVVQLFGNTADMDEIMAIAEEHNLVVIEDASQSPDGLHNGRKTGTIGHMGVFSLNVHKTMSTGEGGVTVTNDSELAERLQLVRNHGEVVVGKKGTKNIANMIGQNWRMCELEAAIAIEQLKKLEALTAPRIDAANYLSQRLVEMPGLTPPVVKAGVRHVYYNYAIKYDAKTTGIPRSWFVNALKAEGIPMVEAYVRPIYMEPMYQQQIAYGTAGWPFTANGRRPNYSKGICPTVEYIDENEMIYTAICRSGVTREDLDDVVRAFEKVLRLGR